MKKIRMLNSGRLKIANLSCMFHVDANIPSAVPLPQRCFSAEKTYYRQTDILPRIPSNWTFGRANKVTASVA